MQFCAWAHVGHFLECTELTPGVQVCHYQEIFFAWWAMNSGRDDGALSAMGWHSDTLRLVVHRI
jgi:hypothetical protein